MSYLTDNPQLMIEALAIMVRRAGGSVHIGENGERMGPFDLMSKIEPDGTLRLRLVEDPGPDMPTETPQ